jgi:electron transfer flavoprotein alpha subunit
MASLLVLLHTEAAGTLARPGREALTATKDLAVSLDLSSFSAGLVGSNVEAAAKEAAGAGADRVLAVSAADFDQARYSTDAAATEALIKTTAADIVIAPATSRWNRVLPGVSHRVGGRVDTHVTALTATDGSPTVNRWFYRQRLEALIQREQRPWIILVDPGTHAPWGESSPTAEIEKVEVPLDDPHARTQVTGIREPAADAQTIRPDAELLFVTGAGWTKKQADGQVHAEEAEKLIVSFLQKTRASLGSSKSLVDLGGEGQTVLPFLTHLNQIGQTGATPRHAKGLSTCCHGEEPHTVGWRFVNERRAINLDANCGWARGKADVLYIADAFAVIRKVNELLGQP